MGDENFNKGTIFFKRKLKWYEKIWYFITGKKQEWKVLEGKIIDIKIKED